MAHAVTPGADSPSSSLYFIPLAPFLIFFPSYYSLFLIADIKKISKYFPLMGRDSWHLLDVCAALW